MQTSLLALDDTGVASQEASPLQRDTVRIAVNSVERAGNTEADCASLTGGAATVHEDDSVELALKLEQHDRGIHLTLQQLRREILLERTAVDGPLASARNQTDTGDSLLATASAVAGSDLGRTGASASVGFGGV